MLHSMAHNLSGVNSSCFSNKMKQEHLYFVTGLPSLDLNITVNIYLINKFRISMVMVIVRIYNHKSRAHYGFAS